MAKKYKILNKQPVIAPKANYLHMNILLSSYSEVPIL